MARTALFLVATALAGAPLVPAAAAAPSPLQAASARLNAVSSLRIDMSFTIGVAGRSVRLTANGIEFPRRHAAALQINMGSSSPRSG